jgi:hypothetical protein
MGAVEKLPETFVDGVLSTEFAQNWDHIRPAFESFVERSDERWTLEFLVQSVWARHKQVWRVNDWQAIALTSVAPDAEYVTIEACYGEGYQDWYAALEAKIEMWAKALGAKRIFVMARPGWVKPLKGQGYREIHRELVKEI